MNFMIFESIRSLKVAASRWVIVSVLVLPGLSSPIAQAASVQVTTAAELAAAVSDANAAGGNTEILLTDGTYKLSDTLYVNAPGVTIAGASGDRDRVIIQGDAMSPDASVGNLIRVAGSDFSMRHVTLQRARFHLIQIVGEADADRAVIEHCVLRDAYQQLLKVSVRESDLSVTADDGLIQDCIFEYSAGIGPQWYIGGIDAHGAKNWIVRDNVFQYIISPGDSVAQFAIHFWNQSAGNLVERNLIMDCDRGIGFGLGTSRGNQGGVIRNNMISRRAEKAGPFASTGIQLETSPDTVVYNNTVFLEDDFPFAIDYRFSGTRNVSVANNLTNRRIQSRDGGTASTSANIATAEADWFVDVSSGDLHLANAGVEAVDNGDGSVPVTDDFDGDSRPAGASVDVGADEFTDAVRPMPPSDVIAD